MIYIYDGTLEGLLSVVFDAYTLKKEPQDVASATTEVQMALDSEYHCVETTDEKADRVMGGLEKIGISGQVMLAFLSWMPGKEMVIFRYIVMGFKIKEKILLNLADDTVRKINDMCGQTDIEKKKWKGFLRFSVTEDNIFYAEMSPKNNVLPIIMPHFCRRFNTKPFLIHDITHKQVGIYDTQEWCLMPSEGLALPNLHSEELKYRFLWKLFYDTTAIEGRLNHKRQRQMMPLRYQKHVTELQEQSCLSDNDNSSAAVIQVTERKKLMG